MFFNAARKYDFTPALLINNNKLEVIEEIKLLGDKITNDIKWNSNTKYISNKAYSRLWMLRRLKILGASHTEHVDCFIKLARSVFEYFAVVWHPGLSQVNTSDIERVQKTACAIILGKQYTSYQSALTYLGLVRLDSRKEDLCSKFAKKSLKSTKHAGWFVKDSNQPNTRRDVKNVKEVQCRASRLKKCAFPYLTHI